MGIFDFFRKLGPKPASPRVRNAISRAKRYEKVSTLKLRNQLIQATNNRQNRAWYRLPLQSPNDEFGDNIINLRKLSRRMTLEDAHTKAYYEALVTNVIGEHGIMFVPKIRRGNTSDTALNTKANTELKKAWNDWSKMPTVNQKGSWVDFQEQVLTTTSEDGECFVNVVVDRRVNQFGIAVEILDAALLDHEFNEDRRMRDGSTVRIRQGIELDSFDRPVAYHFWNKYPNSKLERGTTKRERIPALDLTKKGLQGGVLHIHYSVNDRANALRGKPWLTPVMNWLARLNQYLDAELIAAVMASMTPGYITTPENDPTQYMEPTFKNVNRDNLTQGDDGELLLPKGPEHEMVEMESGTFIKLGPGETIEAPDFDRPNTALEPTAKLYLHAVAAGLGIAYSTLTADNSEETYASGRLGVIQERDQWKRIQDWLARNLHMKIYEAWLRAALASNHMEGLVDRDPRSYMDVEFRPRGWKWADQLREVKSVIEQVKLGVMPPSIIANEFGYDYEETVAQTAADFELMERFGLDPNKIFSSNTGTTREPPDGTRPADEEE